MRFQTVIQSPCQTELVVLNIQNIFIVGRLPFRST